MADPGEPLVDAQAEEGPAPSGEVSGVRAGLRTLAIAFGVLLLVAAGIYWPVPMFVVKPSLEPNARVLLRDPAQLGLPGRYPAVVAATVVAPWKEPVRFRERCSRRAVVTMPAGWVFVGSLSLPGWSVVSHEKSTVTLGFAAGAERVVRPTFLAETTAGAVPAAEPVIVVQRVCGASVKRLGELRVTQVLDQTGAAS